MKNANYIFLIILLLSGCVSVSGNEPDMFLSDDGLSDISESTDFDINIIKKLVPPSFTLKMVKDFTEDESFPVIEMFYKNAPVAKINPEAEGRKIFSILILNNSIKIKDGKKIGDKYLNHKMCSPGIEEYSANLICKADNYLRIWYILGKHGSDWTVTSIMWKK